MKFIFKLLLVCLDKLEKTNYCTFRNIINLICKREYKLSYDKFNKAYKKTYKNGQFIYYSEKKRAVRIHSPYKEMINNLIYSYCLENITFNKGDVIIDCGANIGELGLYFSQQNFDIQYIGFEPSIKEYLACKINHPNSEILNIGLWNEKKELTFYVKSDTADSSLFEIEDFNNIETIKVERLDDVINQKHIKLIKLLKIDAEGAEPEILIGANKLLRKIKYISVDVGPERGLLQESTANETKEILFNNNFELINQNLERKSILFENKNL